METRIDKYVLRPFTLEDYPEFAMWWYPNEAPPLESLPQIGLVSGDMKAIGFLANTDTDFGIITWWYANPENTAKESYNAMKRIFMGLIDASIILNKNKIFCYTQRRSIMRMLESLGFKNYDGHLVAEVS